MKPFGPLRLATLLLLLASPLAAEERPPSPVDNLHRNLTASLRATAIYFDSFFGDRRADEEYDGTLLRLTGSAALRETEDPAVNGRVKARLKLPSLKRRLHLVFSSEDEDVTDVLAHEEAEKVAPKDVQEDSTLSLQFTQKRSAKYGLVHKVGLGFDGGLDPRVRSRFRVSLPLGRSSLVTLSQAVFWGRDEGLGEESRVSFEHPLSERTLLRETANARFSETSTGLEWILLSEVLSSFSNRRPSLWGDSSPGRPARSTGRRSTTSSPSTGSG